MIRPLLIITLNLAHRHIEFFLPHVFLVLLFKEFLEFTGGGVLVGVADLED